MPTSNHITASCVISNGVVYRDKLPVFQQAAQGLKEFLSAVYQHFGVSYPKFYKMDHLSKLGWLAAEILLRDRAAATGLEPGVTGVVLSNANASLDTDLRYFESVQSIASPALFVYTLPNIMIGEICIRHHFKGENAFFISADFDASFTSEYVNGLLDSGVLEACVCGWVDVLGEDYLAVLYLVEKSSRAINSGAGALEQEPHPELFTEENINNIYYLKNG